MDLLKERISVRRYEARLVEREKLERIVDAARLAPSARNEQPWEFVVVTEGTLLDKLAELADYGRFIREASACFAVFCKDTKYYLEDGSAATTYILLAATEEGLGACWVAGDKKPYADEVRLILGLPEGCKLISLVPVGYPAEHHSSAPARKPKRSLAEVLHWEQYQ